MKAIHAYPAINAAIIATTNGANPTPATGSSKNVSIAATVIAGIPMRNENSAASFGFIPRRTAVPMVLPDRDIPGATAIPWAIPIRKARLLVIGASCFFCSDAMKRKNPVTIMRILTVTG